MKLGMIAAAVVIAVFAAGCQSSDPGNMIAHDWDRQHRETVWVWSDLRSKGVDFGRPYKLDLYFVPHSPSADPAGFAEALRSAGYEARCHEGDPTLQATTSAIKLTPESIWVHERQTTEIAFDYGFRPDGWGFLED